MNIRADAISPSSIATGAAGTRKRLGGFERYLSPCLVTDSLKLALHLDAEVELADS